MRDTLVSLAEKLRCIRHKLLAHRHTLMQYTLISPDEFVKLHPTLPLTVVYDSFSNINYLHIMNSK